MFWRPVKIILLLSFLVLVLLLFLKNNQTFSPLSPSIPPTPDFGKKLKDLTLEQKIGQLFIVGFEGKIINEEIEDFVRKYHPAGILLLQRNIENREQLKELTQGLQKIALADTGLPLFIAIDQEGGPVFRIEWMNTIAQKDIKEQDAYKIGKERGEGLMDLGINLNLAPLLDVSFVGDFIYERAFQKSADLIANLGKSLIRGQKDAGILTAVKHFPGYGNIHFNPEEKLAVLKKTPEISQFQAVAEFQPEMIMVSNVVYEDIDKDLPFSFSEKGIQFLKDKIGEDILVLSDDLDQNSLLGSFSLEEIVSKPFLAGVDILIFSGWRQAAEKGITALSAASARGLIPQDLIDQKIKKIIRLKEKTF